MRRDAEISVGLGIPSLVLILLVLCLAMLGVLSLLSARGDYSMALRQSELAASAAQADDDAQHALALLDEQLTAAWLLAEDDAAYTLACRGITRAGDAQIEWIDDERMALRFDAGAQRTLYVELRRVSWHKVGAQRYRIEKYALIDDAQFLQTESLELIGSHPRGINL